MVVCIQHEAPAGFDYCGGGGGCKSSTESLSSLTGSHWSRAMVLIHLHYCSKLIKLLCAAHSPLMLLVYCRLQMLYDTSSLCFIPKGQNAFVLRETDDWSVMRSQSGRTHTVCVFVCSFTHVKCCNQVRLYYTCQVINPLQSEVFI